VTSSAPDGAALTVFECFGENRIACFDGAGEYLRDTAGIRVDEVWIITPPGIRVGAGDELNVRPLDVADPPEATPLLARTERLFAT
jgi:hypothetical protein